MFDKKFGQIQVLLFKKKCPAIVCMDTYAHFSIVACVSFCSDQSITIYIPEWKRIFFKYDRNLWKGHQEEKS